MPNIVLVCITLFFLGGCGESSSDQSTDVATNPDNLPNFTSSEMNLLPSELKNKRFAMKITSNNASIFTDIIPSLNNEFSVYIDRNKVLYLKSPAYSGWRYEGGYQENKRSNSQLELSISLEDLNLNYAIEYIFESNKSGTWTTIFLGEDLAGTFSLHTIPNDINYAFKGTIESEQLIDSSYTGATYPFYVYLPENYSASNTAYPVIFTTDGQWRPKGFFHAVETSGINAILIAIDKGYSDEGAPRRETDFIVPSNSNYIDFLTLEFIPHVESLYNIDSTNRTIEGFSFGGLLVRSLFQNEIERVMHNESRLFKNFISLDGSFWRSEQSYQASESLVFPLNEGLKAKYYLSAAAYGNGSLPFAHFQYLQEQDFTGLELKHQWFNLEHDQHKEPAFRQALRFIYLDE